MHRPEDEPGAPAADDDMRFKWKTRWNVSHNRIFNQHMSASSGDALHCACRNGQTETALELIDLGADVSAKDNRGRTPLHLACLEGRAATALALIARGADISAKDIVGNTPLHYACFSGDVFVAHSSELLEEGVKRMSISGWFSAWNQRVKFVPAWRLSDLL